MQTERTAVLASLYAGLIFGIFWIPLRLLETYGFSGPWAVAIYAGLPALFITPLAWIYRHEYRIAHWHGLLGGVLGGTAFALYALAFLYTDVVRAVLLFYLMPIWGFGLGWLFLRDPMTRVRWVSILLAFAGLSVVFGAKAGLPLPRNTGDWMALASGFVWSFGSLLILMDKQVSIGLQTLHFHAVAALICLVAGIALSSDIPMPDYAGLVAVLPWMIPIALFVVLPGGFATIYGATRLNPGTLALLFMAEIGIAAITAAILTDEPFGPREALGVCLVMMAGLLEPLYDGWRTRRQKALSLD